MRDTSSIFAIELADRAVSLSRNGQVLVSMPAAVFDGGGEEAAGTPAWHALRRQPTRTSTRHFQDLSRAGAPFERATSLVSAQLRQLLTEHPPVDFERVWMVAPAGFDPRALGAVFGIAKTLSLRVEGFVDAAAVSAAAFGLDRTALVLEMGLHHIAVTAVEAGAQARRRRAVVSTAGGLIELYEAWLDLISTAMVKRTRFDPLHEGVTEQQLFDALPGLAQEAARTGSAVAVVEVGQDRFETPLSRDQLAQSGEVVYRDIVRLLHELRPAGAPVALIVPRAVTGLPGLREALDQFLGCELISVADGFASAATSLLELPRPLSEESVRLLRRVPSNPKPMWGEALATRELLGHEGARPPQPSHVLYGGKAFSLAREAVVVGRAPGAQNAIVLPEGLAGVSRRHCTFVRSGGETVLVDHSSYGTFVNGERVSERVRVSAGDRVRVGEPGVELALIAVGEAAGDTHGTTTSQH